MHLTRCAGKRRAALGSKRRRQRFGRVVCHTEVRPDPTRKNGAKGMATDGHRKRAVKGAGSADAQRPVVARNAHDSQNPNKRLAGEHRAALGRRERYDCVLTCRVCIIVTTVYMVARYRQGN